MLTKFVERFSQEINKPENLILFESTVIDPIISHVYSRLKRYIYRVLLMYYLIIILLLTIIIILLIRRK